MFRLTKAVGFVSVTTWAILLVFGCIPASSNEPEPAPESEPEAVSGEDGECVLDGTLSAFCDMIEFYDGFVIGEITNINSFCGFQTPENEVAPPSACARPPQCGVELTIDPVHCFSDASCGSRKFVLGSRVLTSFQYMVDEGSGVLIGAGNEPSIAVGETIGFGFVRVGNAHLAAGPGLLLDFDDEELLVQTHSRGCNGGTAFLEGATVDSVWSLVGECEAPVEPQARAGFDYLGECIAPSDDGAAHCNVADECSGGRVCDPQTRWCVFQCADETDCPVGSCMQEDELRLCRPAD